MELQPEHFEDIVAVTSLYRPGPMQEIPTYISRRHRQSDIKYLHPDLEPILKRRMASLFIKNKSCKLLVNSLILVMVKQIY